MDRLTDLDTAFEANGHGGVPWSRTVSSLDAALDLVRRLGGSIASETRTAPGIGSWALITDPHGNDLVLWEDAVAAG